MYRILIVEDDSDINQMICEYLNGEGFCCSQAFSGSEGQLLFSMSEFDLVILDLMLPGIPGEELIEVFADRVPVIVLSAKNGLDSKIELLKAGADDYMCKPFELPELLVRIQVQLRKRGRQPETGTDETILSYREWTMNPANHEMTAGGVPIELTSHEFLIMELFLRNPKRVFSKQMIYEYAWGEEYLAEDKTINVHISNIRSKLKDSGTDSYIQTVWGLGFKLS